MAMDGMDGRCYVHSFEISENTCRNCGMCFCSECLVYAFGANKPPYCIECALGASGVRSNAGRRPAMSRRNIKRMEKDRKKAVKARNAAPPKVEVQAVDFSPTAATEDDNPFAWADEPNPGQRVPF